MSELLTQARILRIIQISENGYIKARIKTNNIHCVAKGNVPPSLLNIGAFYDFVGDWSISPDSNKKSFKFSKVIPSLPNNKNMIIGFLSHKNFCAGMKTQIANNIYEKLGDNALTTILKDGEKTLCNIPGIGPSLKKNIVSSIRNFKDAIDVYSQLYSIGLNPNGIFDIYQQYGEETVTNLKNNPYLISRQHPEIFPFSVADRIMLENYNKANPSESSIFNPEGFYLEARCRAGIFEILRIAEENGHSYIYEKDAYNKSIKLLSVCPILGTGLFIPERTRMEQCVTNTLKTMLEIKEIIGVESQTGVKIYLPKYREAEITVAKNLLAISNAPINRTVQNPSDSTPLLESLAPLNINWSIEQKEAIDAALVNPFLVITGGPGTGKTTIMTEIVRRFFNDGRTIKLMAPTAKAAERMKKLTGLDAFTIQRSLGFRMDAPPLKNRQNPVNTDVIIVDEFSMVDILLLKDLTDAIAPGTTLIIIGDVDQLPSVGVGNALADIISSNAFVVKKLSHIFRQENASYIPKFADEINQGLVPSNIPSKDIGQAWCKTEEIIPKVKSIIKVLLDEYYIRSLDDLRIITPLRNGEAGSIAYSNSLRGLFNTKEDSTSSIIEFDNQRIFKIGDRVMQNVNNYRTGIMNGEEGFVTEINESSRSISVAFSDNRVISYYEDDIINSQLEISYVTTVHKSQGSEFPCVLLILPQDASSLANRRLLYTAVTRAKSSLFIVGSKQTFIDALKRDELEARNSGLIEEIANTKNSSPRNCVVIEGFTIPSFDDLSDISIPQDLLSFAF